jgi:hypothetical protein
MASKTPRQSLGAAMTGAGAGTGCVTAAMGACVVAGGGVTTTGFG